MSPSQHLPNETLLRVLSHLPLKSLVASRGVDQLWRQFVAVADVDPARRALLNLYLTIVNSPYFLQSRPWVLANLQSFDREAYIDSLLSQYPRLPGDFRLWILEWPARAVVGGAWPGLPFPSCHPDEADDIERFAGINWLSSLPPQVSAIKWTVPDSTYSFDFLPSLLIRAPDEYVWLILDDDEEERRKGTLLLRDKVFTTIQGEDHIEDESGFTDWDDVDTDWIEWLRRKWAQTERTAEQGPPHPDACVVTYGEPLVDRFQGNIANSWVNRFNPRPGDEPLSELRVRG